MQQNMTTTKSGTEQQKSGGEFTQPKVIVEPSIKGLVGQLQPMWQTTTAEQPASNPPSTESSTTEHRFPVIYVAGPYSNEDPAQVLKNVDNALDAGQALLKAGLYPIVPHLTYWWDRRYPNPYERWLDLDLAHLERCDALVKIGDSPGADREYMFAAERGIRVFNNVETAIVWGQTAKRLRAMDEHTQLWADEILEEGKGDPRFHKLLREMGELHDERQAKYGAKGDPFANVRASEAFGIPPHVGALIRAQDKMRRLANMVTGGPGDTKDEAIRDAFLDLAVYAIIGLVLFEEGDTNA